MAVNAETVRRVTKRTATAAFENRKTDGQTKILLFRRFCYFVTCVRGTELRTYVARCCCCRYPLVGPSLFVGYRRTSWRVVTIAARYTAVRVRLSDTVDAPHTEFVTFCGFTDSVATFRDGPCFARFPVVRLLLS